MNSLEVLAFILLWTVENVRGAKDPEFTNMWIAEIHGGEGVAQRVARDLGYTYKGQADMFTNHYVLTRDDCPPISAQSSFHFTRGLLDMDEVKWAEQQFIEEFSKREVIPKDNKENSKHGKTQRDDSIVGSFSTKPSVGSDSIYKYDVVTTQLNDPLWPMQWYYVKVKGDTSKVGSFSTKPSAGADSLSKYDGVTKNIQLISSKPSAYAKQFNDPKWSKQWYYQDYRTEDYPVMDHNVVPVYKMGITGKGVTVAILDDGLQGDHPDLKENYNVTLSYDFCHDKPGSEPDPPLKDHVYSHGTKCAGMAAMVADNAKCGVGAAYEATLAGIKVLGPHTVHYVQSRGLAFNIQHIDIYSCSWGPKEDGKTMAKVAHLTDLALQKGITEGRNGKGVIYTFAAGNGRRKEDDNCGADGLTNHIATIGVGAAGQDGKVSQYSERCSSLFTTGYSSSVHGLEHTVVTDLDGVCSDSFSGTSSATPLISGIIALVLQANPELTYRDVMHLITMSAEVAPLADNGDTWYKNGRGFWVSNDFGFGLLNAENMVTLAKNWENVPEKNTCNIHLKPEKPMEFTVNKHAHLYFKTEACKDTKDAVAYLEHVQVTATVEYPYRGAISITLVSPAGTKTALLETRSKDDSTEGLHDWTLKSVHNWGEEPTGEWNIYVEANTLTGVDDGVGHLKEFTVSLHGTNTMPSHYKNLPRQYAAFRLPNGKTSKD